MTLVQYVQYQVNKQLCGKEMRLYKTLTIILCSSLLNACVASGQKMPLIFAQSQTIGIEVAGSATEQGGKFVLGFDDSNVAIIPVVINGSEGEGDLLAAARDCDGTYNEGSDERCGSIDTFSVFGQFEASVSSEEESTNPGVTLGKFFATGFAARKLAEGFTGKLNEEAADNGTTQEGTQTLVNKQVENSK